MLNVDKLKKIKLLLGGSTPNFLLLTQLIKDKLMLKTLYKIPDFMLDLEWAKYALSPNSYKPTIDYGQSATLSVITGEQPDPTKPLSSSTKLSIPTPDIEMPESMRAMQENFQLDLEAKQLIVASSTDPNKTARGFASGDLDLGEDGEIVDNSPSLKQKLANFGTKNAGAIQAAGQVADMARGLLFSGQAANDSGTTQGINLAYDAISSSLTGFAPVGTVIGGAMKVGALLGDGLQALSGGGTDQTTTTDKIMDSSFFSWNIGAINGFGGKKTQLFSANKDTIALIGGSYGGSVKDINNAASKANKKYGLFSSGSRRKANRQIGEARRQQNIMTGIANEASDLRAMINDLNYTNYQFNINGSYDLRYMRAAKSGMKIDNKINLIKLKRIINNFINLDTKEVDWEPIIDDIELYKNGGIIEEPWEPIIDDIADYWEPIIDDIELYKNGGKTKEELETPEIKETTQKNIIPEGALHKNKHHIENTKGLTLKGIPVIDNDGELQAEVECEEIIFNLEVTKALEERYHKFYDEETKQAEKDLLAIEAGKLLVEQILYNTDDRALLIAKCLEGGIL